jgi:hypothetical protein
MTRLVFLTFFGLSLAMAGAAAQPAALRSVYILPMAGGLDQYLAERLAQEHVMQVVADSKLADTVMTDHLNEAFADTLAKLHPRKDETASEETQHTFHSGSNKGTIFLVDAKSREVIWSDYEKPRRNQSSHMSREAERIVKKMQAALGKDSAK